MLKILQARLQQYVNCELPDVQARFRKGRGTRNQLPTSVGLSKKQENPIKTSISALLTMPKPLTLWITINWKILKEMGIPDHLTCFLRNLYVKAVYCHSAYLTYMQSTSCKMLDWMKHRWNQDGWEKYQ